MRDKMRHPKGLEIWYNLRRGEKRFKARVVQIYHRLRVKRIGLRIASDQANCRPRFSLGNFLHEKR